MAISWVRSNTFNFTFRLRAEDGREVVPLRHVLPGTLEEALKIVSRYQLDQQQLAGEDATPG